MTRRKFSSKFKTKVVLEALSERYTLSQMAERHQLHPNQISQWKSHFLTKAETLFEGKSKSARSEEEKREDALLRVIGQQKVEIDFLKKVLR